MEIDPYCEETGFEDFTLGSDSTNEVLVRWVQLAQRLQHLDLGPQMSIITAILRIVHGDTAILLHYINEELEGIRADMLDNAKLLHSLGAWQGLLHQLSKQKKLTADTVSQCLAITENISQIQSTGEQRIGPFPPRRDLEITSDPSLGELHGRFLQLETQLTRLEKDLSEISTSMASSISLIESHRQIAEASLVTKLTELAVLFHPSGVLHYYIRDAGQGVPERSVARNVGVYGRGCRYGVVHIAPPTQK
ncbi:hypothetical protein K469DRAFT_23482 [Zopfia rhizophila CBS 207.26]|uniref:Uncharacterized protein n=1 Tax=Zopfia rhizophila CBS 207.26 TaxID=1314779 RepID=A0A6A6EG99_9PEZI|nr:hypothetical protein K469DRAFT_23482 [Zopfia rhizophila CBS 207.26]